MEVGGHDHWESLRYYHPKNGEAYRNLFVGTGISPDHGNLPGFNTFKINHKTLKPTDLIETSLDITKTYGKEEIPPLKSIKTFTVNFAKDFGITDLTAKTISRVYEKVFDTEEKKIHYLSAKLGYKHNENKPR